MKYKLILLGILLTFVISSCTAPKYLPKVKEIDVNPFGSYISINLLTGPNIKGELIAVDNNQLVVLTDSSNLRTALVIPINFVKNYKLQYAKPTNYSMMIPLYTSATIGHGYFLIFTAPLNLIVTTLVTTGGKTAFQYTNNEITYETLKMFARFPQGIPPNIDLANIE
jgi:small nuclear ribonucleoprotein (snRNP)-like protein